MLRDLQSGRYPDALVAQHIIEKPHQRCRAARTADGPTMQAERNHLRRRRAFGIEHVKTVLQIAEERLATAKALRIDEAHVVGIERVRDNEMRSGRPLD